MSKSSSGLRKLWRVLRWPLGALLALLLLPALLVPAYWVVPPVSVPMVYRTLTGQPVDRQWRDLDQVSHRLQASVIMSEDGQFCRHWGVDVAALQAEVQDWLQGGAVRGASTITMQVARNLFLWNDRSYLRKALEVPLAVYIDLVLSKKRILEIYLNIAEWGPEGQFGVEAGAQAAFGTSAELFSWERATLLTTALPNPNTRLPGNPNANITRVASIIQERTRQYWPRTTCVFDTIPELF